MFNKYSLKRINHFPVLVQFEVVVSFVVHTLVCGQGEPGYLYGDSEGSAVRNRENQIKIIVSVLKKRISLRDLHETDIHRILSGGLQIALNEHIPDAIGTATAVIPRRNGMQS